MQTAVVWTCVLFIRSGQNHLARHSEKGKKTRQTGRQRKRWEDNIREWTGLEFAKSQRAVKNRGKWRMQYNQTRKGIQLESKTSHQNWSKQVERM